MKYWTIFELMILGAGELTELRRNLVQDLDTKTISAVERRQVLEVIWRVDFVLARKISRPVPRPGASGPRPPSP
jgi:hypothetical protein